MKIMILSRVFNISMCSYIPQAIVCNTEETFDFHSFSIPIIRVQIHVVKRPITYNVHKLPQ